MTYAETLDYLYNALPMFSRMGSAAFKKDLTNTKLLCDHLGHPEKKFKSIHVAGTNGKGSVSHMLAAVLQSAGYKTGLYTSPHLYDFRERIKINGEPVPEAFVTRFTDSIKPLAEAIQPSFFEMTVAMAFRYFAEAAVDIAVIEVGLGGRLDSTNVITPELSVITNIGWDHMNLLGNTLEEIAAEKAGIMKQNIPVVIGETLPQTRPVFEEVAKAKASPLSFAEELFTPTEHHLYKNGLQVSYAKKESGTISVETDLPGFYQVKNIATVLTATDVLKTLNFNLEDAVVLTALKKVKALTGLQGRWEVLVQKPTVVLDVAHNKAGIEQTLVHLSQLPFRRLHLVFGMVKDKDADGILSTLPPSALYYFTQAQLPRALPAAELALLAGNQQLAGHHYDNVNAALKAALTVAHADDFILVCGSIFLVAEVKRDLFTDGFLND